MRDSQLEGRGQLRVGALLLRGRRPQVVLLCCGCQILEGEGDERVLERGEAI